MLSEDERRYFFETFGNICHKIYVEKIVQQWPRTQFDKQNDVEATGMYGQGIKKYKKTCPFTFMYLQSNWDGTTSPCTLDWAKKVVVGNVKHEAVSDIWKGERLRDLQVAQLQGHRDKIDFCNDCSAPMVCCKDDLDDHAETILERITNLRGSGDGPNPWINSK